MINLAKGSLKKFNVAQKMILVSKLKGVKIKMKQLDVVVSPPAYVWDPNLTLTHVTLDLDPRDLLTSRSSMNFS